MYMWAAAARLALHARRQVLRGEVAARRPRGAVLMPASRRRAFLWGGIMEWVLVVCVVFLLVSALRYYDHYHVL